MLLSSAKSGSSYGAFAAVTCFGKPRPRASFESPSAGLDVRAKRLEVAAACFSCDGYFGKLGAAKWAHVGEARLNAGFNSSLARLYISAKGLYVVEATPHCASPRSLCGGNSKSKSH